MTNASLKDNSEKKDDMAQIVGELDDQFDAWEKNQKTGEAQKINDKEEHLCPLCGSKVEKAVDVGHIDAMKDGLERAKKEQFSEMEEQVKFVKALEEAIKDRNKEIEIETMMHDLSGKKVEDLIVDIPKRRRRVVETEPLPQVPKVDVIHRVPLPGDSTKVIHRVPLPGNSTDVSSRSSWPYYGTMPKQKHKIVKTIRF